MNWYVKDLSKSKTSASVLLPETNGQVRVVILGVVARILSKVRLDVRAS